MMFEYLAKNHRDVILWGPVIFLVLIMAWRNIININKYPTRVQKCYNEIIYSEGTCTFNKRAILKYCICIEDIQDLIAEKREEANAEILVKTLYSSFVNPSYNVLDRSIFDIEDTKNSFSYYQNELYKECAKKTGYTSCD